MTDLTNPIYHDNDAARRYLEAIRWPDGPYCPHCGVFDSVHRLGGKAGADLLDLNGFEGPDCGKHKNLYLGPWRDETAKGTILAKINRSRSSWSTVPVM